ncbi:hypothetical protein [Streptomyces sp. NPDC048665]|uniref:hypothetical protein n=1 Tax=Streptomyces sp. NPDC048665 TaxID=3155490 RepID=UPI003445BB06
MPEQPPNPPLPPDPHRLRVILAFLNGQIADNDTLAAYLRIQRGAVHKALARAGRPTQQQPPARGAKDSRSLPRLQPGAYEDLLRRSAETHPARTRCRPDSELGILD